MLRFGAASGLILRLRPAGLRFGVFIKQAIVKNLQRHQNVVHQSGVPVQFVCELAAGWLQPRASLRVSRTPKTGDF